MSSSQEREVGFQAEIKKPRKKLEETEHTRQKMTGNEGNIKWRLTRSVADVQEIQKPGDQTAGSQKEDNGDNQLPEELGKERDRGKSRRAEKRWKAIFESEVDK